MRKINQSHLHSFIRMLTLFENCQLSGGLMLINFSDVISEEVIERSPIKLFKMP